jgi:hypothetical protein
VTLGDLNWDGKVTAADWALYKAGHGSAVGGMTKLQAYLSGDVNGDLAFDLADFSAFRQAFDAANGVGAFAAMAAAVPEPSALGLAVVVAVCQWHAARGLATRRPRVQWGHEQGRLSR